MRKLLLDGRRLRVAPYLAATWGTYHPTANRQQHWQAFDTGLAREQESPTQRVIEHGVDAEGVSDGRGEGHSDELARL